MRQDIEKGPAWWLVILMIFLFWPVGLYLLFRRLNPDKASATKDSALLLLLAVLLFFIGLCTFAVTVESEKITLFGMTMASLYCFGGGLCTFKSWLIWKTQRRKKAYINLIVSQGITSIEDLATRQSVSFTKCCTDLQVMIMDGCFQGGTYIDRENNTIVLPSDARVPSIPAPPTAARVPSAPMSPAGPEVKVIKCPGCGANNKVVGGGGCEYCGSPLG